MKLRETFEELVREQETLGFDDDSGLRRNLRDAGNAVERILNANMTWLADADSGKLMMLLLIMRHHEAAYRLNQMEITRQQFLAAYKQFTDLFAQIDGTPAMKEFARAPSEELRQYVRAMDRRLRPRPPAARDDRHRQPGHAAAGRPDHRTRPPDRCRGVLGAYGGAGADAHRHHHGRHRHGRARARLQLADRPQHHASAQRSGRRDEAPGRRRHLRAHSRHRRARRDRRDGAHRHRLPRHHDRARKRWRRPRAKRAAARTSAATRSRSPSRSSSARSKARSASCAPPR